MFDFKLAPQSAKVLIYYQKKPTPFIAGFLEIFAKNFELLPGLKQVTVTGHCSPKMKQFQLLRAMYHTHWFGNVFFKLKILTLSATLFQRQGQFVVF